MDIKKSNYIEQLEFCRINNFSNKVLIIDGQPGCGKTLFSQICSSFERLEIFNYAFEIEFICKLNYFNKLDDSTCSSLIKMFLDHKIYQTMMGRETNFRFNDLSGVFNHSDPFEYLKRIFSKGDREVPDLIKSKNPILNLTCHDLFCHSSILFSSLKERLVFFEIIRHPLYMLIQQHINEIELNNNPRDVQLKIFYNNQEIPYFAHDFRDQYVKLSAIDRAVLVIKKMTERNNAEREKIIKKNTNYLLIPFENFVLNPESYLNNICKLLNTKFGKKTIKVLKKNKIPRKTIEDGIDLPVYRRYGWKPAANKTSFEIEKNKRVKYLVDNNASQESIDIIYDLSNQYEQQYPWF
jgi:hypothetical protein